MDARSLILVSNDFQQSTAVFVVTGLNPGVINTFHAQYRASVTTATCNFANRSIWAIPLP